VRAALEAHGLQLAAAAIYERPYSIASGREGLRYLRSLRPPPTAIICGNDVMAMGALAECASLGIKVPAELSIVGFDNLELAGHLDPPLTTMEVPAEEMGERAADFLVDRVLGQPTPGAIKIEPKLIVRRTTARPPP
jgi:LacI family transcriptional regulator